MLSIVAKIYEIILNARLKVLIETRPEIPKAVSEKEEKCRTNITHETNNRKKIQQQHIHGVYRPREGL